MHKILFLFFVSLWGTINMFSGEHLNFNDGWKFQLGDMAGAEATNYNDAKWRVLDFGRTKGGNVQWYQENDGSAGDFVLQIRYSSPVDGKVLLDVNGKVQTIDIVASSDFRNQWQTFKVKAKLGKGANTIRLTSVDDIGLCVDELLVK